ncbi:hypothetical protein [Georgenia alba]|uniref:DUF3459 domain-containing protein n=1 Tax=Georgenia alba TaxID=2233858 RepID=A0ABW2Q9S6_9MICO
MSETQPAEPAPPITPAGQVITTLVHRPSRAPVPWWRRAVVYQVHGPADLAAVAALSGEVSHVARLGATAVELRVPDVDPADPEHEETVAELVRRVHQRSLRLVVSLADVPAATTLARADAWLGAGADGLDLGILTGPPQADLGSLHALAAEHDAVLTAAISARHPELVTEHLHEHWLHVTREDALAITEWDAGHLRAVVSDTYLQREAAGAVPAWTLSDLGGGGVWGLGADGAARRRRRAATLLMLALPGTVYIHQGEAVGVAPRPDDPVGTIREVAAMAAEQRGTPGSLFERYRYALRLRDELGLGTGPLAWVDDAPGPSTLALLTRDLLVLTNLSGETVAVPSDREVLHASDDLPLPSDGLVFLPPDTTVWLALG